MAVLKHDLVVAQAIDASLGSVVLGTNAFVGEKRPPGGGVPHKAVFFNATSGSSRAIHDAPRHRERRPRVTARVRGDPLSVPGAFAAGQQWAREIMDAGDANPPSGYCECIVVGGEPDFIGVDADSHPEWLVAFDLIVDFIP